MKIAVTGSAGHVGANMLRGLLGKGFELRAIYHREGKLSALAELEIEKLQGDVLDLVTATIAAIEKGGKGERYLLSGNWATTRELASICERISGTPAPRLNLPVWVAMLGLPFNRLYSKLSNSPPLYTYESLMALKRSNKFCSHEKAGRELNYKPRPLEESVRDIYAWFAKPR